MAFVMIDDNIARVEDEYSLLKAMYPGEIAYNAKANEFSYNDTSGASLIIRISQSYPACERPQIISATDHQKVDLRNELREAIQPLPVGEEILDTIIANFQDLLRNRNQAGEAAAVPPDEREIRMETEHQTIIIWLHHLLNANKRKLALSPSSNAIAGISKPGYPGMLIFSGPALEVQEHVQILKQQNWAAFQIRYENSVEWVFQHGTGVKEFESMSQVVTDIGDRKVEFLEAMRMR